uniref:Uncharacterized protein n=1 Tax=Amphimedon queenslandica TaxID=400682 RepID=A0A1X7V7T5_AMPQE
MASSLTTASAFVRDVSSPKCVSWGGTRVNAGRKHSTDSTSIVKIFQDDLEKVRAAEVTSCSLSKTLALHDDYESSESDDESSDDERTL